MQTRPCRGEITIVTNSFSNVPASVAAPPFVFSRTRAYMRLTNRSARTNPNY